MKDKFLQGILTCSILLLTACSKKDSTPKVDDTVPVPLVQYDNSNFGLYRGVFIGSKGSVTINVNNDNTLSATFKVDGTNYNFTTTQSVQQGQPISLNFVGGSNSFIFTAAANGSNPAVTNLVFAGHPNAQVVVMKTYSYSWADIFQCTYREDAVGGETGVFMLIIVSNVVNGLGNDDAFLNTYHITGTQGNNHVICTTPLTGGGGNTDIVGDVSTDNSTITGTFSNIYGTGTWTGVRIL